LFVPASQDADVEKAKSYRPSDASQKRKSNYSDEIVGDKLSYTFVMIAAFLQHLQKAVSHMHAAVSFPEVLACLRQAPRVGKGRRCSAIRGLIKRAIRLSADGAMARIAQAGLAWT
jgi:hypothetical protein